MPVVLLAAGAVVAWQARQPVVHAIDGWTMGSTWSVRVVGRRGLDTAALKAGIEAELQRLDQQLSGYRPDTGLSRLNRAPVGEWVALPGDLAAVIAFGLGLWHDSDGAFDMTVRPLVLAWGFGAAEPRSTPPSDAEVAAALANTGSEHLALSPDGKRLRRLADVTIDVDATAPGYVADVIAGWLADRGLDSHLVEVGGELRASGLRPDGHGWRVGIERPELARGEVEAVIEVSDIAVATSGDYRDYFEVDGVRYAHTLDPATGRPVSHALASVTVLAPSTMAADGYATAIGVMGPEAGLAWANARGLPVFMLVRNRDGSITERYNAAFAPFLAKAPGGTP